MQPPGCEGRKCDWVFALFGKWVLKLVKSMIIDLGGDKMLN